MPYLRIPDFKSEYLQCVQIIKEEHFLEELNFCYLNERGRRIFLPEYQEKLDTTLNNARLKRNVSYQRLMRIECYKLIKHLLGQSTYGGLRSKYDQCT